MATAGINYRPVVQTEEADKVHVYWFPTNYSQSHIAGRKIESNSCTVVTLLMTNKCRNLSSIVQGHDDQCLKDHVTTALVESIVQGDDMYNKLQERGALRYGNMTVPEGITALELKKQSITEWRSTVYSSGSSLISSLEQGVQDWYEHPLTSKKLELFVILVTENKSVLFIFQKDLDSIIFVDSHEHHDNGAVVAVARFKHLHELCHWYLDLMSRCYGRQPDTFEVCFLYYRN